MLQQQEATARENLFSGYDLGIYYDEMFGSPSQPRPHYEEVFAALYNDADFGADNAGISRLPALGARNIAGATVSAWSARIGDGQSTYRDGYVTAVNGRAARCGGEIGISAIELVARLVAARVKDLSK